MKIGIITLHRVRNYGSALQAYALQKYLQQTTKNKVELIDYIYPNIDHKIKLSVYKQLRKIARIIRDYTFNKVAQRHKLFNKFYHIHFNLSQTKYSSIEQIHNNAPIYDMYITGSDQVWNVNTLQNDPVMYCTFAPQGAKRISFGASFTIKQLPQCYKQEIKQRLECYSAIGVREKLSLKILEELKLNNNIKKTCTCDPTLLLNANDYEKLSSKSKIKINQNYILVYSLDYAYNPEPAISMVTEIIERQLKLPVIIIDNSKFDYKGSYKRIKGIGPCEFIYLIKNAKYVITSSFHGTMFSLIYRKPFVSILPPSKHQDYRTKDILTTIGLENNGINATEIKPKISLDNPYTSEVEHKITTYINESKEFLQDTLST